MERKIKIACTSTGCLEYAPERYRDPRIDIIRIHMWFKGKEYLEGIGFEPEDFYEQMLNIKEVKKELPHTGMPSYEEVSAPIKKAIEEGYTDMIIVVISSYLGGTWNFIRLVAQDYADKIKITVVDSLITCFPEGYIAWKAQQLADEGKDHETIIREIEWIKAHKEFVGADGRLDYLILNGRLKGAAAFMGKMMSICPVIHFNHDGELVSISTAMGISKAIKKADEVLLGYIGDRKKEDYILFRVFTGKVFYNKLLRQEEIYKIEPNHEDVIMSCVTGINIGPWAVGYGYIPLRKKEEELPPLPQYYFDQHPEAK